MSGKHCARFRKNCSTKELVIKAQTKVCLKFCLMSWWLAYDILGVL